MHVLWDWNGTLLDDTDAAVATLNQMLSKRGLRNVTREFFRERFAFPAREFYNLVGMSVPDRDWDALAKEYHDLYHAQPYALNRGAFAALEAVAAAGAEQSVLSALNQRSLDDECERFGVRRFFARVFGSDNLDGGRKIDRARELAALIRGGAPGTRLVVIGDSLHDCEVAREIGADCVLFTGGSHAAHRLAAVAPIADTLVEAVRRGV